MTDVIAWPPVSTIGYEFTIEQPESSSRSLFGEETFLSVTQRQRRVGVMVVPGVGANKANAGYVEMLKRRLLGRIKLVRVATRPAVWHGVTRDRDLSLDSVGWTAATLPLSWTARGASLDWFDGLVLTGARTTDAGFPAIRVTGLPPNTVVVQPSEVITVYGDTGSAIGRAMRPATSNAAGVAVIRLLDDLPFGGTVSIGGSESVVFRITDFPRAVQPVSGGWSYEFPFREAFAEEYPDGWNEIDPWR